MKRILLNMCMLFLILITATYSYPQHKTTVTDIDGNVYPIVEIGTQKWMGENLKTTKYNNGTSIEFANGVQMDWYNNTSGMYTWYNDDAQNKGVYGALYNWFAATNTNICPVNWHVPTDDEWRTLRDFVGTSEGTKLKATTGWSNDGNGTDDYGFAALPGGYVSSTFSYSNVGIQGLWWTSVEKNTEDANNAELRGNNDWLDIYYHDKGHGLSIRCIKNEGVQEEVASLTTRAVTSITQTTATSGGNVTNNGGAEVTARGVCWSTSQTPTIADSKTENGTGVGEFTSNLTGLTANTTYYVRAYATNSAGTGYGNEVVFTTEEEYSGETVTDIDGNVYPVVEIGTQKWMGKNLETSRLNDGTAIGNNTGTNWTTDATPAYCWYNDDIINKDRYGALYNFHAVATEKLCPVGWHVPTDEDWNILETFLDPLGDDNAGGKMKSPRTEPEAHPRWDSPNEGATNESGFSALPGGFRSVGDGFQYVGHHGRWWSSSPVANIPNRATYKSIYHNSVRLSGTSNLTKELGYSVRCVEGEATIVSPIVTTNAITNIIQTTATSGGNITDDGGAEVTARGVCWSTTQNPTVADSKTEDGTGVGEFTSNLTGLTANTKYYVRAYATNSAGTGYGNEVEFTTEEEYSGETVTDIDGNVYPVVEIGTQKWMGKNLKTTKYNDETPIEYPGNDNTAWENNSTGAYAWYDNNETNKAVYGALYNWFAVETSKLCPNEWHVAADDDWKILEAFLGINDAELDETGERGTDEGGMLKETGTGHWANPNTGATNSTGFTAVPSGTRYMSGGYAEKLYWGSIWTSTPSSYPTNAVIRMLSYNDSKITRYTIGGKHAGFAVRCIKNADITPPAISTTTITTITQTTATSGGNITDNGGADVTARGVCWSTSPSPTVADSKTEDGTGVGEFTSNLTGLTTNTKHYVRAYATNSAGTGYGNEVEFTTSNIESFTEPEWVHLNYENSSIPSGYGVKAQEDSKGNIWLASMGSITKYTPEGQMVTYENSAATSDYSSFVLENDNTMWVCNRTDGFFKFDGQGNWTQYNTENTSMTSNYIHSIAIDSKGNKWITTNNGGLVKYDGASWTVYTKENSDLPANSIYSIFIDKNDNVWLGLSGYLVKFDGTTWSIWTSGETDNGVGGVISAIAIDESDNIWIGKDWNLGVAKASLNNLSSWTKYNYGNSDYPESRSVAIDFDADGRVWFGTDSKGLTVFDGSTWYTYNSTNSNWPSNDWVVSIFKDSKENTWLGTHNGFVLIGQYVPTVSTREVSDIMQTSALSGGTIDFYGGADISTKGVVWSTTVSPTLDLNDGYTDNGTGTAEFTSELTNLTAGTTYYLRAYATNSAGTGYDEQIEFTTEEDAPADALPLPFVDGFEEDISHWTIRDDDGDGYSWEISSDDPHSGTKHLKVRWNTDGNNDWLISPLLSFPAGESISLSLLAKSELSSLLESFDVKVISNNGQQIDIISSEVDVPDSYTEFSYDLSSYAGQDVRVAIVCVSVNQYYLFVDDFSCNVTVETAETPTVTTTSISNITQTSASSGGTITSDGGADITVKGVCWSTSASPTITDSKTENGTGISEYSSELTNLAGSTTYYVRAYATNSAGTGYGEQKEFTTTSTGSIIMTTTSLNVYPNPFANNLTIKSDKGIKQIVVTNISGQVVMQKLVNGEISKQINTEKLGSGLYLLQVIDINGNSTHIQLVKP